MNNLLILKNLKSVALHFKPLHVRIQNNEDITCIKIKYDNHSIFRQSTFLPYSKFHLKKKDGTMGKIKAPAYAAYSYLNLRYSLYKLLHVTSWHQLTGQWNFIQTRFPHLHSFKNSISFTQMIKLAHLRSVFQQYKKHSENQLKCFLENWDNEHSI